jgi:hypothetical protein
LGSGLQLPPLHFTSQLALAAQVVWHFPPLQSMLAVALAATLLWQLPPEHVRLHVEPGPQ